MSARQKLVFIGNIPAPYQVKLIRALNEFYEAEGWFYEPANRKRETFWFMPSGKECRIIPRVSFTKNGRYLTTAHLKWLRDFQPDILLLGGFSIPANYLAYSWAKKAGKKIVVITEASRSADGALRKKSWQWRLLRRLYAKTDAVFAVTPEAKQQFSETLGFGEKVVQARYPTDLDEYLQHPLRNPKDIYTLLFANRLTPRYNPLLALEIFRVVCGAFPATRLLLNGSGPLRSDCEKFIALNGLNASFLDNLRRWDDLDKVYRNSDILLFPANFSAGNFTIYESMASGMGIVISDRVEGNGEIIVDGENGYRKPMLLQAFAGAALNYLRNPELLKKHGEINKKKTAPLGIAETARFYHALLSKLP